MRHLIFPPKNKSSLRARRGREREKKRRQNKQRKWLSEGKGKKMGKEKRRGIILAFTGAAAVLAIAANLAITAIKYQKAKNAKKKGTTSSQLFNFLLNVCLVNKLLKFQDRFTESSSGNL